MERNDKSSPSLENLIESENLGIEILHPGGLAITKELADLCKIGEHSKVLEIASGTGESACFLKEKFGCEIIGIDYSDLMVKKAQNKAAARNLNIPFEKGDAHSLRFESHFFDAVIAECTLCLLDKEKVLREMVRTTKQGGYVGIHDICWKDDAPESIKHKLLEIEGESPETLRGWKQLFEDVGLVDIVIIDKSTLIKDYARKIKKQIKFPQKILIFYKIFKKWGVQGLLRILESERIFTSCYTGYGILVGKKP